MLTRIRDKNIWTVYGAILLLGIAYGISIALIAHHLDVRGFTKPEMGSLASWFALGIVSLSLPMGAMIRRLSAKVTLVASLAGYAVTVSLFPALDSFALIAVDRFLDGACSVGIWVSCETILLARAEQGMKASVTTLYAVSLAIGYVIGPLAAHQIVQIASIQRAFLVSGALSSLATLVVILWLDRDGPEMAREASEPGSETPQLVHHGGKLGSVVFKIKTSSCRSISWKRRGSPGRTRSSSLSSSRSGCSCSRTWRDASAIVTGTFS